MIKATELSSPSSCLNKAAPDEPLFVLRAKDPVASMAIRHWATMARGYHEDEKISTRLRRPRRSSDGAISASQRKNLKRHYSSGEIAHLECAGSGDCDADEGASDAGWAGDLSVHARVRAPYLAGSGCCSGARALRLREGQAHRCGGDGRWQGQSEDQGCDAGAFPGFAAISRQIGAAMKPSPLGAGFAFFRWLALTDVMPSMHYGGRPGWHCEACRITWMRMQRGDWP